MAPHVVKRAQRQEIFVPKGTTTVSDVYPTMKKYDLYTLLKLRADNALAKMMQLQSQDAEAAAKLVQQLQSPNKVDVTLAASSESPEMIGVSASYDDFHESPRNSIGGSVSDDAHQSPARQKPATPDQPYRRMSVKERVMQLQAARSGDKPDLDKPPAPGAIALAGISGGLSSPSIDFEEDDSALAVAPSVGLRVQGSHLKNEVVDRLSAKRQNPFPADDDSKADSDTNSVNESTLEEDAKLYQQRLNNRNNLVKRDAASFRVKRDSAGTKPPGERPVPKVSAARLHSLRAKHSLKHGGSGEPVRAIYTYDQLRNRTVEELATNPYPADVDEENREQYLKDDEFFQVFGLTKADFNSIAKWRKIEMKKKKNLYG